jgi:lipoprotein-anchoring transpeptidase ErfK/SrfK
MNGRRRVAVSLVVVAAIGGLVTVREKGVRVNSNQRISTPLRLHGTELPSPPPSVLHVGRPRLLNDADASMWAAVRRPSVVREAPGGGRIVGRVGAQTPEGTTNVVLVLHEDTVKGTTWCKVRLPSTSAPRTGWIPRSALGALHIVVTHLDVNLARLRLTLTVNGAPVLRAPVGVGRPETPTPVGDFYIRDKLTRYNSPFYGPIAFGTSARSAVLTEWPAGGFIGIHGTDEPGLIPGRVSHGCIRLRNDDLRRLSRLLPIGTPVTIIRG